MNRHIAIALLTAGTVLAVAADPVPPPPPYGAPPQRPAEDSAQLARFAQAFAQPGQLPDSAGGWMPVLPDSVRLRLQAAHQAQLALRDSLRARLPSHPDSLRQQVTALRDSADRRRGTYLESMNPVDRARVAPRLEDLDRRTTSRRDAIEASSSSLKGRKGGAAGN